MTTKRYTSSLAGRSIAVDASARGFTSWARLYIDDRCVDEQTATLEEIRLTYDDIDVRVLCVLPGRVSRCALVLREEPGDDSDEPVEHRVPFDPPPGTRAAKLAEFQRAHPRLYAARHVAIAIAQAVAAVLGLGVLVRGLLPRIDWSWLPDIDTSWVPDLSWIPDPFSWLVGLLPDISIPWPDWLDPVFDSTKYWLPVLIAIGVAAAEVDKRRKARAAKAERDQ